MKENLQKTAAFFSNGLVYGLNGIYLIIPLFLSKYFNSVQSGYLLAIQPLLLCIAPLFWGGVTDKAKNQNVVMIFLLLISSLSILSLRLSSNFIFVGVALTLFAFFQAPYGSLIDVLTIKTAEKFRTNYGIYRITGSVGYAVFAYLITLLSDTDDFVYIYLVVALLGALSVAAMNKVETKIKKVKKSSGDAKKLLNNKELWLLVGILAAGFFTWGYYTSFFPTYITETLGLKKSVWGIVAFLTAFSELPFFIYYGKIFEKISMRTIVSFSCFVMVLRWLAFATVKNAAVLIGISFITGMFITVLTYCVTFYIVSVISHGLINRAQSLMYAVGTGITKVLAGCIGGYMTEYLSEPVSFIICAAISLLAMIVALVCKKTMDSIDEKIRRYR